MSLNIDGQLITNEILGSKNKEVVLDAFIYGIQEHVDIEGLEYEENPDEYLAESFKENCVYYRIIPRVLFEYSLIAQTLEVNIKLVDTCYIQSINDQISNFNQKKYLRDIFENEIEEEVLLLKPWIIIKGKLEKKLFILNKNREYLENLFTKFKNGEIQREDGTYIKPDFTELEEEISNQYLDRIHEHFDE